MSPRIDRIDVGAFEIPTVGQPERDGTAAWWSTTIVVVHLRAAGVTGLGYTYVHAAAAKVIEDLLRPCVLTADPWAQPELHARMSRAVRNHGRCGIAACAIAAVDTALWDLRARLLDVPVTTLLGIARDEVPVYASGGFTSTPPGDLRHELEGYVAAGHRRIKIKIGRPLAVTIERVVAAREVIGPDIELMVDANGAFTAKEALAVATRLEELGVTYFEEPVSSDDLAGLRFLREATTRTAIAAGEYGYDETYFRRMLEARAVDILQADATRCLGITGFLQADALCDAFGVPLSAHTAPALHAHAGRASRRLVHVEHFSDHVRIEAMLFDGAPRVADGNLISDGQGPGLGLTLREREAARFAA